MRQPVSVVSVLAWALTVACATQPASQSSAAQSATTRRAPAIEAQIEGEALYAVLPRDAIVAIDQPRFVGAEEGAAFMAPHEPVIGVVGPRGTARAYSLWTLDSAEIVNDVLDDEPIAVTWCPLANTSLVYRRSSEFDDSVLSFGVSGKLWHGMLVLYDRASGSLWTHLDGRAIQGERAGERLSTRPSIYTSWAEWVAAYPDTQVLDKNEQQRQRTQSPYADYFANPTELYFEHLDDGLEVLGPKAVVFGVEFEGDAVAVDERVLMRHGSVLVQVGATPVVLVRDPRTGGVDALDARLDEEGAHLLTPDGAGGLAASGHADSRTLDNLSTLQAKRAYWYAWARTHPHSAVLAMPEHASRRATTPLTPR